MLIKNVVSFAVNMTLKLKSWFTENIQFVGMMIIDEY